MARQVTSLTFLKAGWLVVSQSRDSSSNRAADETSMYNMDMPFNKINSCANYFKQTKAKERLAIVILDSGQKGNWSCVFKQPKYFYLKEQSSTRFGIA